MALTLRRSRTRFQSVHQSNDTEIRNCRQRFGFLKDEECDDVGKDVNGSKPIWGSGVTWVERAGQIKNCDGRLEAPLKPVLSFASKVWRRLLFLAGIRSTMNDVYCGRDSWELLDSNAQWLVMMLASNGSGSRQRQRLIMRDAEYVTWILSWVWEGLVKQRRRLDWRF